MSSLVRSLYLDTNVFIAAAERGTFYGPSDRLVSLVKARHLTVAGSEPLRQELASTRRPAARQNALGLYAQLISFEFPANREAIRLADRYLQDVHLKALDAEHLAYAVVCGADVFLSWNRKDLVKPSTIDRVTTVNAMHGLRTPRILDPSAFLQKAHPTARLGRMVLD